MHPDRVLWDKKRIHVFVLFSLFFIFYFIFIYLFIFLPEVKDGYEQICQIVGLILNIATRTC